LVKLGASPIEVDQFAGVTDLREWLQSRTPSQSQQADLFS
jgi:hypothetical protein